MSNANFAIYWQTKSSQLTVIQTKLLNASTYNINTHILIFFRWPYDRFVIWPIIYPRTRFSFCYNHQCNCSIHGKTAMLHIAGTTCKAYSKIGKCDKDMALSFGHFIVWCALRHILEEPILTLENVADFPAEELCNILPQYEWTNVVVSPEMLGIPIRRERIYAVRLSWIILAFRTHTSSYHHIISFLSLPPEAWSHEVTPSP